MLMRFVIFFFRFFHEKSFVISCGFLLLFLPKLGFTQFRSPIQNDDTAHILLTDGSFQSHDSTLHVWDLPIQFLAGEAAFNITSFSLWGNDLYKISSDNELGVIGLLASTITVPLAIYFSSELLGINNGSIGYSIGGAALGLLVAAPALILSGVIPRTYLGAYLGFSLPIIIFAQTLYDFSIK
jgi:hypothetical protein